MNVYSRCYIITGKGFVSEGRVNKDDGGFCLRPVCFVS